MSFADVSIVGLRVFRAVAERGTLTAAAGALGYTQSAVSRQVASVERAAGARLLERRHDGVHLTPAGQLVLRRAVTVLDQLDATARELAGLPDGAGTVRLGWFTSAGAVLVPQALAALRRSHPAVTVVSREGSTPSLVRALRAGTLDLALLAAAPPFRPPDGSPALVLTTLAERGLRVAVPAGHPWPARPPSTSPTCTACRGSRAVPRPTNASWACGPASTNAPRSPTPPATGSPSSTSSPPAAA
ncbi:hypothetical protein GCM10027610_058350 [Dactylosporangium cerinum]